MLEKQWSTSQSFIIVFNKRKDKYKLNTNHKLQSFSGEKQTTTLIVKVLKQLAFNGNNVNSSDPQNIALPTKHLKFYHKKIIIYSNVLYPKKLKKRHITQDRVRHSHYNSLSVTISHYLNP